MKAPKPANMAEAFNKWNGDGYRAKMTQAELEAREEFEREKHALGIRWANGELSLIGLLAEIAKLDREANRKIDQARRSGEPDSVTRVV